jgi:hypothetical protein
MEKIVKIKASYWGNHRKGKDGTKLMDFHFLENGEVLYTYLSTFESREITITEDPESFIACYGITAKDL